MADGVRQVFIDSFATYGHVLELYEPTATLSDFCETVRRSVDDRGQAAIIDIAFD